MGVLSWRVWLSPNCQRPLAAKLCVRPKSFGGARTCCRSSITMSSLVGLGFHPPPGWLKTLSFFVCLSVHHAFERQFVHPISPWRRWSAETILIPLDRGRIVAVHWCSTFSDCCQLATPLNAEVQKMAKLGVFANKGRQNKPIETKFGMLVGWLGFNGTFNTE